ncbi:hypothetical protein [Dyadobacter sp. LHD-138]|uniref:hypothetical protein n=1 Tax=Dyadobacter sp. LHD-138 TaxID=3071413 RepID=UPI0027E199C2|nr:hypothetical protein [Dyadobacter sp. LHD-138]MDQ6480173.1 hypothetical protein [Dyadobacter sp. LHD-138]
MSSSEFKYHTGLVKINEYLFHLHNECKRGQFDVAQNTFLDLQQHWQRQDVLLKSIQNQLVRKSYFPSDSLHRLEKFLNNIYLSSSNGHDSTLVMKEIRRINSRIDQMQSLSGR